MALQSFKIAWKAIAANKMRSFLTMLGIIIGVLALVVLVSLVTSATSAVTDSIESMGNDMLTVAVLDDKGNPIKLKDMDDIAGDESIALTTPILQLNGTAKVGNETYDVSVEGTNSAYFSIEGSELAAGRFLKTADLDNVSHVAVVSYEAAEDAFGIDSAAGARDVVGQTALLNGRKFLVVGVLAEDESIMAAMMSSNAVYIPFTTAERMSDSGSGISQFYAAAKDSESVDRAEQALTEALTSRFRGDEDAFRILNQNTLADTMSDVTNIFALLLGGIAAISLLVGGIGIMNIMLVSVTERTREIGIRKAIGARRAGIMLQFIIEALVICLIGCTIGVAASGGIVTLVSAAMPDMTFSLSGGVIVVAVLFSTAIGLLFGLYPARKAAGMNPIDALRYE
ncbi:MAG: ABC transporter permease [Clostridiales Family XIII bacterium]|jgi:putative ABC transport system permease protein|nr:ABC transporter permease [Clostridiales Family XIII bacterium]